MIIYKDVDFSMAHKIDESKGLDENIHGHDCKLSVGINISKLDKKDVSVTPKVIGFTISQELIQFVNHAIWLKNSAKNKNLIKELKLQKQKMIISKFNPSAECMVLMFWKMLSVKLPLYTLTFTVGNEKVSINNNNYTQMKKYIDTDIDFSGGNL